MSFSIRIVSSSSLYKCPINFGPFSLPYVIVIVLLLLSCCEGKVKIPDGLDVPAVFAFGDSIVDQGMNNYIKTIIKANFVPYGADLNGGNPSGRFCNGRTPADLVASELGIKELVPAYLDPQLKTQDMITGVSFASGGTGYDPQTPEIASVISLPTQVNYFKEYIGKLKGFVGEERANYILNNALYLVVAGSDDLANTYFTIGIRKLQYDIPSYADLMVSGASTFIEEIYNLGARRYVVFGAPPIGCLPSQRTLAGGLLRICKDEYNQAAQIVNSKLEPATESLTTKLSGSRVVFVDIYNPLLDLILHPQDHGFEVADKGCCGTGDIEVSVLCNKHSPTCSDHSKYIFWDSYHPTERAYTVIISELLKVYINRFL
ncbi:hydrolase [Lithospermum erythrorhizon]|uniref:Hydrolase n=1 Tax=Lithospermum erythrorhizon TaxID=34254 RepID=A0AAV3PDD9_LITER